MSQPPEDVNGTTMPINDDPVASQASVKTEPAFDIVPDTEPPSEWDSLRAELSVRPFEPTKWYRLVQLAEMSGESAKIAAAYDGLLNAYPNTVCVVSLQRVL
jgi:hypothetical protein